MLEISCKNCKVFFGIDCIDDIEDKDYSPSRIEKLIEDKKGNLHCPICGGEAKETSDTFF